MALDVFDVFYSLAWLVLSCVFLVNKQVYGFALPRVGGWVGAGRSGQVYRRQGVLGNEVVVAIDRAHYGTYDSL